MRNALAGHFKFDSYSKFTLNLLIQRMGVVKLSVKRMKKNFFILTIIIILILGVVMVFALNQQSMKNHTIPVSNLGQSQPISTGVQEEASNEVDTQQRTITITVGSERFTATLADNPTAQAFAELLPLTLNMNDVNNNEKAYDLENNLPTNASNPGRIQNGDIMLYGSNTLVLFYESFDTSNTYTRIGSVDNPAGLSEALGSGNARVTFQVN